MEQQINTSPQQVNCLVNQMHRTARNHFITKCIPDWNTTTDLFFLDLLKSFSHKN